jgi:phosphoheptose isomerase
MTIQDLFRLLAADQARTQAIASDILTSYREGRKILVLTERTAHLDAIKVALSDAVDHLFAIHGRMSK